MRRFDQFLWIALIVLVAVVDLRSQSGNKQLGTATEIRLAEPGWWPTKGTPKRDEYVGSTACEECHAAQSQSQKNSAMAHALIPAVNAQPLQEASRIPLSFHVAEYGYQFTQSEKGPVYSVSNGTQSLSVVLNWAVGKNEFGQTYIYEQNGALYESRVSYYHSTQALDFTIGTPRSAPGRLEDALGRRMYPDDARLCFGCHSTAATTSDHFDPSRLIPGVTCEACHGPALQHVTAANRGFGDSPGSYMTDLSRLSPADSVDFCGACHRTTVDAALSGVKGIFKLRFPASRLEASRCWGTGDARLTCVACHNPHQSLVKDAASYDIHCLSCHVVGKASKLTKDHPGAACPISQKNCATCHMPRFSIPEMHTTFTDHKIRIYRSGEPFQD
jgi:hypothetical protein